MNEFTLKKLKQLIDDWHRLDESIDELNEFILDSSIPTWEKVGASSLRESYAIERESVVRSIGIALSASYKPEEMVYCVNDFSFSLLGGELIPQQVEVINCG